MRGRLAGAVGVWLLACAALVAADFWDDRDFTAWSDKEVEKMLTDSPWAKQVTIVMGSLTGGPLPTLPSGGAIPVIPFPGCGGEQFEAIRRAKVTVAWSSALPIKQALVRQAIGLDAPIPSDSQQLLAQDEPFYAVALLGLPPVFAALAGTVDALKAETMLKRKDKEPIAPDDIRLFQDARDQSIRVVFLFPKTDAITLDDKDVEVITKLGDVDVKKKFKLADMMFRDELAL